MTLPSISEPELDPDSLHALFAENKVTLAFVTPEILNQLFRTNNAMSKLSLKHIFEQGQPVPKEQFTKTLSNIDREGCSPQYLPNLQDGFVQAGQKSRGCAIPPRRGSVMR